MRTLIFTNTFAAPGEGCQQEGSRLLSSENPSLEGSSVLLVSNASLRPLWNPPPSFPLATLGGSAHLWGTP